MHKAKITCAFCAKGENEVQHLIKSLRGTYICDECVKLCQDILQKKRTYTVIHNSGEATYTFPGLYFRVNDRGDLDMFQGNRHGVAHYKAGEWHSIINKNDA